MAIMRTANPALSAKAFEGYRISGLEEKMTIQGTVNKTALLLLLVFMSAFYTWGKFSVDNPSIVQPWIITGAIAGLILAVITIFKKTAAPITTPLYALAEGLVLGGVSAFFDTMFPGIVIQAVALTFGTLFALLVAYKSGLIKATENFKLGVTAATGAVFLVYLIDFIMRFFSSGMTFLHGNGLLGIGISVVIVVIAALNLVLDFDFIENAAENGAPKYMEWYGAFGLIVTLVWLYLEILRLLSKLRSSN